MVVVVVVVVEEKEEEEGSRRRKRRRKAIEHCPSPDKAGRQAASTQTPQDTLI